MTDVTPGLLHDTALVLSYAGPGSRSLVEGTLLASGHIFRSQRGSNFLLPVERKSKMVPSCITGAVGWLYKKKKIKCRMRIGHVQTNQ